MKLAAVLAFLFAPGAPGQQGLPAQPNPAAQQQFCRVEGTVVSTTGEKIRKATVILRPSDFQKTAYQATSDADGHFLFENIDAGSYRLTGDRPGFLSTAYTRVGRSLAGSMLRLAPGQKTTALELKLTPQSVVTGKIVDEDGDPVAPVLVQLLRRRFNRGKPQLAPMGGNTANEEGEFRLAGLPAGSYYLRAVAQRLGFMGQAAKRADGKPEEAYVATYFPSAMDISGAAIVEVPAGQTVAGLTVQLHRAPVFRVSGKIVGQISADTRNPMVRAVRQENHDTGLFQGFDGSQMTGYVTNERFEIQGLTSGLYTLFLFGAQGMTKNLGRQQVSVGNADVDNITLNLQADLTITATVRMEADGVPRPSGIHITLTGNPGSAAPGGAAKDDGVVTITNVSPEEYQLTFANLPQGAYVKSAVWKDKDVLRSPLDLRQASGQVAIEIKLSMSAAQIGGTVTTEAGQPAESASVLVLEDPEPETDFNRQHFAIADQSGNFRVKALPPGKYKIFAFENVDYDSLGDPEVMKQIESKAVKVEVAENGSAQVQLVSIPASAAP